MSRWIRISLPLSLILMSASLAAASDIFFAPNAAGSNNGTSCANAFAYNDGTNGWSQSASQSPGNNLHVCPGTYNVSGGGTILSTTKSGNSGSPITLIADQGTATFQSPSFSAGGAISVNNSYWVINGENNLTMQNTQNGTSGASCPAGSCSLHNQSVGVSINGSNVTVENLVIQDIYVHVPLNPSGDSCCTTMYGIIGLGANNATISGNTISQVRVAVNLWGSNVTINNNTLTDNAASWWFGSGSATSGVVFHDNNMSNVANWENGGFHLEYVHLFTFEGAISGLQAYNNYFGSPGADCCQTAKFYHEGSSSEEQIFNNVFYNANNGIDYMPGIEFETQTGGGGFKQTNPTIVNNTFLGGSLQKSGNTDFFYDVGVSGLTWQNNVGTGGQTLASFGSSGFASGGVNYNAYENLAKDYGSGQTFGYNGSNYNTLGSWQSALPSGDGQDSASVFQSMSSLLLNGDGTLQSGSPAIGLGANLTNLGIAALNSDKNGIARPNSGAWDAGAYQFGGTSGGPPNPPTGLAAVVN
jgi:hypothetical protein